MEQSTDIRPGKPRLVAVFYLVAAAVLWSLGGVFIKEVEWNPMAIAGMRSAFASVLMWAVLRKPRFTWSRDQVLCAAAYAVTVILFVIANKLTTAANAILLQYTAPIYVAVFGFLVLKEKTTRLDWITIIITVGGMTLFFADSLDARGLLGNILAVIDGMTFGAVILLMRKLKDSGSMDAILLGNIFTAAVGIPFMFQSYPPSSSTVLTLMLMGVVQLGLPYILFALAIKSVSALDAALIPVIEPVLNPIWVFLLIGEVPGKWAITGGVIVLAAVTYRCVFTTVKTSPKSASGI